MTTPPVLPQALKAHAFRDCELLFALAGDDRLRESESQDDRQRCVRDVVCPSETCGVDPIVVVDSLKACEVETTLNNPKPSAPVPPRYTLRAWLDAQRVYPLHEIILGVVF